MKKISNSSILQIILLFFLVFVDFFTKYLWDLYLVWKKINIIWDFFYLSLHKNPWIAFSISLPYIKIITIILILFLIYYFFRFEKNKNNIFINISFIFIISWAIWNAWERIFFWEVTDFFWIKYFSVFNFADIYINIWIILYLFIIFLKKDN